MMKCLKHKRIDACTKLYFLFVYIIYLLFMYVKYILYIFSEYYFIYLLLFSSNRNKTSDSVHQFLHEI